jgi:dienelactone hydrolase
MVILLQGFNVDKSQYRRFASRVCGYGFVVVVPNFPGVFDLGLLADTGMVEAVLDFLEAESGRAGSVLAGRVRVDRFGFFGHSFGGVGALHAGRDVCGPPFCSGGPGRPAGLRAVAAYGSDLADPIRGGPIPVIDNGDVAVAILRGSLDGISEEANVLETFDRVLNPPRFLITVLGANHFGLTEVSNPSGTVADAMAGTVDQGSSIETIGRWAGMFFRGTVLGDGAALSWVTEAGGDLDSGVGVVIE